MPDDCTSIKDHAALFDEIPRSVILEFISEYIVDLNVEAASAWSVLMGQSRSRMNVYTGIRAGSTSSILFTGAYREILDIESHPNGRETIVAISNQRTDRLVIDLQH